MVYDPLQSTKTGLDAYNEKFRSMLLQGAGWQDAQKQTMAELQIEDDGSFEEVDFLGVRTGDRLYSNGEEFPITTNESGSLMVRSAEGEDVPYFKAYLNSGEDARFHRPTHLNGLEYTTKESMLQIGNQVEQRPMTLEEIDAYNQTLDRSKMSWTEDYMRYGEDKNFAEHLNEQGVHIPFSESATKISEDINYQLASTNGIIDQTGLMFQEWGRRTRSLFDGLNEEQEKAVHKFWEGEPEEKTWGMKKGSLFSAVAVGALGSVGIREPFKEYEPKTPTESLLALTGELVGWIPVFKAAKYIARPLVKTMAPKILAGMESKFGAYYSTKVAERMAKSQSKIMDVLKTPIDNISFEMKNGKLMANISKQTKRAAEAVKGEVYGKTVLDAAGKEIVQKGYAEEMVTAVAAGQLFEQIIELADVVTGGEWNPGMAVGFGLTYMMDVPFARSAATKAMMKDGSMKELQNQLHFYGQRCVDDGIISPSALDAIKKLKPQEFVDLRPLILEDLKLGMSNQVKLSYAKQVVNRGVNLKQVSPLHGEINPEANFQDYIPEEVLAFLSKELNQIEHTLSGINRKKNGTRLDEILYQVGEMQRQFVDGGPAAVEKAFQMRNLVDVTKRQMGVSSKDLEAIRAFDKNPLLLYANMENSSRYLDSFIARTEYTKPKNPATSAPSDKLTDDLKNIFNDIDNDPDLSDIGKIVEKQRAAEKMREVPESQYTEEGDIMGEGFSMTQTEPEKLPGTAMVPYDEGMQNKLGKPLDKEPTVFDEAGMVDDTGVPEFPESDFIDGVNEQGLDIDGNLVEAKGGIGERAQPDLFGGKVGKPAETISPNFDKRRTTALYNILPSNADGDLGQLMRLVKDSPDAELREEFKAIQKRVIGILGDNNDAKAIAGSIKKSMKDTGAEATLKEMEAVHQMIAEATVKATRKNWDEGLQRLYVGVSDEHVAASKLDGSLQKVDDYQELDNAFRSDWDNNKLDIERELKAKFAGREAEWQKSMDKFDANMKSDGVQSIDKVLATANAANDTKDGWMLASIIKEGKSRSDATKATAAHITRARNDKLKEAFPGLIQGVDMELATNRLTEKTYLSNRMAIYCEINKTTPEQIPAEQLDEMADEAVGYYLAGKTAEKRRPSEVSTAERQGRVNQLVQDVKKGNIKSKYYTEPTDVSPTHVWWNNNGEPSTLTQVTGDESISVPIDIQIWKDTGKIVPKETGSFRTRTVEPGKIESNMKQYDEQGVGMMDLSKTDAYPIDNTPGVSSNVARSVDDAVVDENFMGKVFDKGGKMASVVIKKLGKKDKLQKLTKKNLPIENVSFGDLKGDVYVYFQPFRMQSLSSKLGKAAVPEYLSEVMKKGKVLAKNPRTQTTETIAIHIDDLKKMQNGEKAFDQMRQQGVISSIVDMGDKTVSVPMTTEAKRSLISKVGTKEETFKAVTATSDAHMAMSDDLSTIYSSGTTPSLVQTNEWFKAQFGAMAGVSDDQLRVLAQEGAVDLDASFVDYLLGQREFYNKDMLTKSGSNLRNILENELYRLDNISSLPIGEVAFRRRLLAQLPYMRGLEKATIMKSGKKIPMKDYIRNALGLTGLASGYHFFAPEVAHAAGTSGEIDIGYNDDYQGWGWGMLAMGAGVALAMRYGKGKDISKMAGKQLRNSFTKIKNAHSTKDAVVDVKHLSTEQRQSLSHASESMGFFKSLKDYEKAFGASPHTNTPEFQQLRKNIIDLEGIDPENMDLQAFMEGFRNISGHMAAATGRPLRTNAKDMGAYVKYTMTPWQVAKVHPEVAPHVYAAMNRTIQENKILGEMHEQMPQFFNIMQSTGKKSGFNREAFELLDNVIYDQVNGREWDTAAKDAVRRTFKDNGLEKNAEVAVEVLDEMIAMRNGRIEALIQSRMEPKFKEKYLAAKGGNKVNLPYNHGKGDYVMFMYDDATIGRQVAETGSPAPDGKVLYWRKVKDKKEAVELQHKAIDEVNKHWAGTEGWADKTADDFILARAQTGQMEGNVDADDMLGMLMAVAEEQGTKLSSIAKRSKRPETKGKWQAKANEVAEVGKTIRTLRTETVSKELIEKLSGRKFSIDWNELHDVPGMSKEKGLENFLEFARGNAAATPRKFQKMMYDKADQALQVSGMNTKVLEWLKDYKKYTLYGPDSHKWAQRIARTKNIFYISQLASNVASPVINTTGLVTMLPQELTKRAQYLGIRNKFMVTKLIGAAVKDIGRNAKLITRIGKGHSIGDWRKSGLTWDEIAMLNRSSLEGLTGQTMATEFSADLASSAMGSGLGNRGKMANFLAKANFAGGWLFAKSEEFTRVTTQLAAYRLEKQGNSALVQELKAGSKGKVGMEWEKAYQRSVEANTNVNIDFNPWNRPLGASKASGAFSPLFTFRSFMFNYMNSFAMHIDDAFKSARGGTELAGAADMNMMQNIGAKFTEAASGLKDKSNRNAALADLKPAAQMMFGLWMLGGMQALPGVQGVEETVSQGKVGGGLLSKIVGGGVGIRPSTEADMWLTEALGKPGHIIAEVLSKGVPGGVGAAGLEGVPVLTHAAGMGLPDVRRPEELIGISASMSTQMRAWLNKVTKQLRKTGKNPLIYDPLTKQAGEWTDLMIGECPLVPRGIRKATKAISTIGEPELTRGGSLRLGADGRPVSPSLTERIVTGLAFNPYSRNKKIEEKTLQYDLSRWKKNIRQPLVDDYQRAIATRNMKELKNLTKYVIPEYRKYIKDMSRKLKLPSILRMDFGPAAQNAARRPATRDKLTTGVLRDVARRRTGE